MDTPETTLHFRNRPPDAIRPVTIELGFLERVPGSVLYSSGLTRVLCAATFEEGAPLFVESRQSGWATAEYDLLPGSTIPRHVRERGGRLSGRTLEIQRTIGRALRSVLNLHAFPSRTLKVDCDVIEADGGTRTAAMNGAWLATALAVAEELRSGRLDSSPITAQLSAVSVGVVGEQILVDLNQDEDSRADVDLNVAMTDQGDMVEIQGTAEGNPFSREVFFRLLHLAEEGIAQIRQAQLESLERAGISELSR